MAIVALLAVVLVAVVIYLVRRLANVERAVKRTMAEVRHQVTPADLHTAFGQWVEANPGAVTTACAPYINRSVAVAASAMRVHAPAPPAPQHPSLRQPAPTVSQPPAQSHVPRPGPPPHFAPQQSHPHHQAPPHPAQQGGPVHGSRPTPLAVAPPTQPQLRPQPAPLSSAPTTPRGHCQGEGQAFEPQRAHTGAPPQQAQPPPASQTAQATQTAAQTGRPPFGAPSRPQTSHGAPSPVPAGVSRSLPMPRAAPPRMRCEGDVCVIVEDDEDEDDDHRRNDGHDDGRTLVTIGAGDDRHREDAHDDAEQNGHPLQASASHLDRYVQDTLDAISHASNDDDEDDDDEDDKDDNDKDEDDTTSDKNKRGGANGSADLDADRADLVSDGGAPSACASDPWAMPDEARFFVGHGDESEGDDDQDDERDQPGGGGWYGHETPSLFIVLGTPTNGLGTSFGGLARARITPLGEDDGNGDSENDDDDDEEEEEEEEEKDDNGNGDDDDDDDDMRACRQWANAHRDQILSAAHEADATLKARIDAKENALSINDEEEQEDEAGLLGGDSDSDEEQPGALSSVVGRIDDGPAWSLPIDDAKDAGHAVAQEDPHDAADLDARPDGAVAEEHPADKSSADGDQRVDTEASADDEDDEEVEDTAQEDSDSGVGTDKESAIAEQDRDRATTNDNSDNDNERDSDDREEDEAGDTVSSAAGDGSTSGDGDLGAPTEAAQGDAGGSD